MERSKQEKQEVKMTKSELWQEICVLVDCTHFTEKDKELFLKLINDYGLACKIAPL